MKASTSLFATELVDKEMDIVLNRLQRHSFPHNPAHRGKGRPIAIA